MAKKKSSRSKFMSSPMTIDEAARLFANNKAFRELAHRAAMKMGLEKTPYKRGVVAKGGETSMASYRLVTNVVSMSREMSPRFFTPKGGKPKYVHPSIILYWIATGKVPSTSRSRISATALFQMMKAFGTPMNISRGWNSFLKEVGGEINDKAFFFQEKVHPLTTPGSGNMTGFYLKELVVRVPSGWRAADEPDKFNIVTIDLMSPQIVERFGKIWMGVTHDRKSVFLASEKAGASTTLADLVKIGTMRQASWSSGLTYPRSRAKAKLPESIKKKLEAKGSGQSRLVAIDK